MKILNTLEELAKWRASFKASERVGFVPTMGALHIGHSHLLSVSKSRCDQTALSIFVNPLQFGANEDFTRYPKTWEKDLETARSKGVDAVFAPSALEMYPEGFSTRIEESELSGPLCGVFRPGHFSGVATVVMKLFQMVEPHEAFFGMKDAQQFLLLRKVASDLSMKLKVLGVPTIREEDGLALSSRNVYLDVVERKEAPALYQALSRIEKECASVRDLGQFNSLCDQERKNLEKRGWKVQYLEGRALPYLGELNDSLLKKPLLLAAAAFLGKTRLIDNSWIGLNEGTRSSFGILSS